jgi:hypothetical protein
LNTVFDKIAHRKITKHSILTKESELLDTLEFSLEKPTLFDLVKHLLCNIVSYSDNINLSLNKPMKEYLDKVILYLSKMSVHDYELLLQFEYKNIAAGCVYVGLKTLEQVEKKFVPENHLKSICDYSDLL